MTAPNGTPATGLAERPNATRMRRLYEIGSSGDVDWAADALADDIVKVSAFWALIDDIAAFDEFFA